MSIEELCEILNGYAFKSDNYVEEGVRIIRIANVQKGYIEDNTPVFCQYDNLELEKYMLMENDLLISLTGNVGRVALLTKEFLPAALNQRVACLRLKNKEVLKKYLFYCLSANGFEEKCIRSAKGVAQKNMSTEWLKKYKIPLYSSNEQIQIVRSLDFISRTINNRKKQLQKLDELIQARFVEMFGDINVNPLGWDTYSLDECFEIASSKRILKSEWKTEGIPFLRVRDVVQLVTTGKIDNDFFVSEEFYATLKDSDGIPKQGDVLVSATSTLGKCYIVESGERFYFKDADVLRFRSKKNINPVFFVEQMKTQYIEKQIARTLGVTTVAHFTIKAAKTINMRLPPIELQNQFADFVNQVNKSKLVIKNLLQIYKHQIQM